MNADKRTQIFLGRKLPVGPRPWRVLCFGSFLILVVLGGVGGMLEQVVEPPLPYLVVVWGCMGLAFLGFIISVPPVVIRFFIAGQERIGNAEHALVRFLREHEWQVVRAVWLLWALGALIAVPAAVYDWMQAP
ncbi:MAG: hypothetical protein A3F74_15570 [Betaproteobacteria bacterium RIFCSPLOWO2_12_FULL_62_58]|nr:MAG: hypothetical protein A3F74_15570 [Betaproteobacteria bacterium RIFCSPLOWO2_12_FULL_62_58]